MRIPDKFAALLLDSLRPREREVLGLSAFDQFEIPEIAHLLQINPNSASGHISKGLAKVACIVDSTVDNARDLLEAMGETCARRKPKERLVFKDITIDVLPHRELMGAAVRHDEHLSVDTLRYFVVGVNGVDLNVIDAEKWALETEIKLSSNVIRELLHSKNIKSRAKFNKEIVRYFWPFRFGCVELYYARDFDHQARTLPLPPGESILDFNHLPPVPDPTPEMRTNLLPRKWPFRVIELGEYEKTYDDAMAEDAEAALRKRGQR